MAIISCPRCGGTGKGRSGEGKCRLCGGVGKVEVNEEELEKEVKREKRRNGAKDIL